MKKITFITVLFSLVLSLTACDSSENKSVETADFASEEVKENVSEEFGEPVEVYIDENGEEVAIYEAPEEKVEDEVITYDDIDLNELLNELTTQHPPKDDIAINTDNDLNNIKNFMGLKEGFEADTSKVKKYTRLYNPNPQTPQEIYDIVILDLGNVSIDDSEAYLCVMDLDVSLNELYTNIGIQALKSNLITEEDYDRIISPEIGFNDRYVWTYIGEDLHGCNEQLEEIFYLK